MKKNLILTALCALLGMLYYVVEVRQVIEAELEEEAGRQVVIFAPETVQKIILRGFGAEETLLNKQHGKWLFEQPLRCAADSGAVERLINAFASMRSEKRMGVYNGASGYGLQAPRVVELVTGSGGMAILHIGDKTPTGGAYYLVAKSAKGEGELMTVATGAIDRLETGFFPLRKKKLVDLPLQGVTRLEITKGDSSVVVDRDDGSWRSDTTDRLDNGAIDGLLARITTLSATGFYDEQEPDLAHYGLLAPAARVRLLDGAGKPTTLLFGAPTGQGGRFVMREEGKIIARITDELFPALPDSLDGFVDFSLLSLAPDAITAVTYQRGKNRFSLRALPEEGGWELVQPEKKRADATAVFSWLHEVVSLTGITSLPDGVRYSPNATITLTDREGAKHSLSVGVDEEYGPVAVSGGKGPYRIDVLPYDSVTKVSGDSLADHHLFSSAAKDVSRIVIAWHERKFDLRYESDSYRMEAPERRPLRPAEWRRLLWSVTGLRYSAPSDKKGEDSEPFATIMVYTADAAKPESVRFFHDEKNGDYSAITRNGRYRVAVSEIIERVKPALARLIGEE